LSEEAEGYITVVEVKHYAYCPRIVYFTHALHLDERVTEAMEEGSTQHDEATIAPLIAKLKALKVLKGVELASSKLKVRGRPDYIIVTRHHEYIPVEVKWAEPTPTGQVKHDHKLQLAAYAILIEENYNTVVKRAAIHYTRASKTLTIPITHDLKQQAIRTINEIHRVIGSEQPPPPLKDRDKCRNCGFKQYCLPPLGKGRGVLID